MKGVTRMMRIMIMIMIIHMKTIAILITELPIKMIRKRIFMTIVIRILTTTTTIIIIITIIIIVI